jgi:hypothetical protein
MARLHSTNTLGRPLLPYDPFRLKTRSAMNDPWVRARIALSARQSQQNRRNTVSLNSPQLFTAPPTDLSHFKSLLEEIASNPISLELWSAVSQFLYNNDLSDRNLSLQLLRLATPVLDSAEEPQLFKAVIVSIARVIFLIPQKCETLVSLQILESFSALLCPEIGNDVILAVNDLLIAALSDYSGDPQLYGVFNGYHCQIISLLSVKGNQFLRGELLRTSHLIVQKCGQTDEDCVQLFWAYAEWICSDDEFLKGRELKCLYEVMKKSSCLYRFVLSSQGAALLLVLIESLNTESLESVKYSSKILLPLMSEPAAVALFMEIGIIAQIQQSIALSSGNVKYLIDLVASMCETLEPACVSILEAGILYSEKLKQFSLKTSTAMLRIYAAAMGYGIQIRDDDSIGQIVMNVSYCLECDDDDVILLALRIAKALSLVPCDITPDVIEELTMHRHPAISLLAGELSNIMRAE